MFDRVVMDIIHVPVQIFAITDDMVPKAPLPKDCVILLIDCLFIAVYKAQLDGLHDGRKILFPRCNDPMKMIVQDHIGMHGKTGR